MRSNVGRGIMLALAAGLLTTATPARAIKLQVGSGAALPGATAVVPVSLVSEGATVAGTENVIGFDAAAPIGQRTLSTTLAQAIGATDTAIPVVDASAFPDLGTVVIDNETIQFGRVDGNTLVVGGCTNVPQGQTVKLACKESSECNGGTCAPLNRGQNCQQGQDCKAAHNQGAAVTSPPSSPLPDCRRNASLTGVGTGFAFTNLACFTTPACETPPCQEPHPTCECSFSGTPRMCDAIVAIVVKTQDLNTPIPDGTLYSCNVPISGNAQLGTVYPLSCPASVSLTSTPDGTQAAATCTQDAKVTVGAGCAGDCDGKNGVSLAEIQTGILIKKGSKELSTCPAMDGDNSGVVSLSEIQKAILAKKNRCGL